MKKITDIAERVGMSVGLLFHYFESKEKLYEELVAMGISEPMKLMAPGDMEPLEFFEATAKQIFHYIKSEPFTAKMFVLISQANSTIREGDPHALAIAYWGAITGIAQQVAFNPDGPCPESDWVVDIIRRKPVL